MSSVGPYLRELRERRGVSLEEIARVTRVVRCYLEAIEGGRFEELPAPVFTRGFIRSYCQALGEAPDEALARYANPTGDIDAAGAAVRTAPADPRTIDRRGRGPVLVSFVLLVVLGVALFAVTLALQAGRDGRADRRADPARVEPSRADAPSGERMPSTTPPAGAPTDAAPPPGAATPSDIVTSLPPPAPLSGDAPTPSPLTTAPRSGTPAPDHVSPERPTPPTAPTSVTATGERVSARATAPYRLIARTTQPTWIRVRTEDGHASEETIPAGQTREWVSNRRFTVAIGNAGGVSLELNGVAIPPLGANGVVIPRLVLPADEP